MKNSVIENHNSRDDGSAAKTLFLPSKKSYIECQKASVNESSEKCVTNDKNIDTVVSNTEKYEESMPKRQSFREELVSCENQGMKKRIEEERPGTNNASERATDPNLISRQTSASEIVTAFKTKLVALMNTLTSKLHREYLYFSICAMIISILCFYNLMYQS